MSDEEYLASVRKAREESVRFFDSANKPERERWVASEFLANLGLEFTESEIQCVSDEPPDIRFRSAAFEVKEILDKGRRRHTEFKTALEKANSARSPSDLLEPVTPRDITYTEVCNLVVAEVVRFAAKYAPATRSNLDLLFYVNLEDVFGYVATPLPPPSKWEAYGFRSISVVMGRLAGVLMAAQTAPDFLKNSGPRVILKPRDHEKNAI
jgi:Putative endonuclease, protein of unknown function (DUF1780)